MGWYHLLPFGITLAVGLGTLLYQVFHNNPRQRQAKPVTKVQEESFSRSTETCSLCTSGENSLSNKLISTNVCRHKIHEKCLTLLKESGSEFCLICRKPMNALT